MSVRVLPLQALSLLMLPLPWTLPRLFGLLLADPVAVVEGARPCSSIPYMRSMYSCPTVYLSRSVTSVPCFTCRR